MLYVETEFEAASFTKGFCYVAGVDEAGRGAWAGPLVAAAVVFPRYIIEHKNAHEALASIRDSKKLTANKREKLYDCITEYAQFYAVAEVNHQDIDIHGIQWANIRAMTLAVRNLAQPPDYVFSDSYIKPDGFVGEAVVKGDDKVFSIAAASILAKVTRDRIMSAYDTTYPAYGFAQHKGYGTKQHREALQRHGPCVLHRKSFAPIKELRNELP